jgi:hypothetical protein
LEVIPAKKTYRAGETMFVRYRITNLSDVTMCFPAPALKTNKPLDGYVHTRVTSNQRRGEDFIESFYSRDVRTDQELIGEANASWIKLVPGLSYVTDEVHLVAVSAVGDWTIQADYSPPYLRGRASLVTDSLSCTPPESVATSKPVNISSIAASESQ